MEKKKLFIVTLKYYIYYNSLLFYITEFYIPNNDNKWINKLKKFFL